MTPKLITVHFTNNSFAQLGLTPTIDIFELGVSIPSANIHVIAGDNLTEVGGGWYKYTFTGYSPTKNYVFTIDGGPSLSPCERFKYGGNQSYVEEIAPAVWEEQLTNHTNSGSTGLILNQIKADTNSILISEIAITTLLNTLLKYQRNNTKIDVANAQMIIFDDDGITPLTVFDLKDALGNPSVAEVCGRFRVV